VGDTSNTIARLCASATSAQIVVSEATVGHHGNRIEMEEIEPRSLKGKERPMRRFNILRQRASAVAKAG